MSFTSILWNRIKESKWKLGILEEGFDDLTKDNIKWVSQGRYTGKWFADPFILEYDNKQIKLLVEEFDYKIHKGRIARIIIDKNSWTIIDCKILLDLATHLSFPLIIREDDHIYVFPENYHSGIWGMYEYNTNTEELIYVKEIMHDKLTDATIFKFNNLYYLISTYEPTPNGKKLTIWSSKQLSGDYNKFQEIEFEENIARNAGCVFAHKGKLVRPAQECNYNYGNSIIFQELIIKGGKFFFTEMYRYKSTHKVYCRGAHTFNMFNKMGVIDVKGLRYPILGGFVIGTYKLLVKIGIKKQVVLS